MVNRPTVIHFKSVKNHIQSQFWEKPSLTFTPDRHTQKMTHFNMSNEIKTSIAKQLYTLIMIQHLTFIITATVNFFFTQFYSCVHVADSPPSRSFFSELPSFVYALHIYPTLIKSKYFYLKNTRVPIQFGFRRL